MRSILERCLRTTMLPGATIALVLGACGQAQQPGEARTPTVPLELHLESLQSLLTADVHALQPLARGDEIARTGTAERRLVAHVRDAEFAADGRLGALLVEPPMPRSDAPELRRLPADAVQWHAADGWIVNQPNLQFASLETVAEDKTPVDAARARTEPSLHRASRLLQASFAVPAVPAREGQDGKQVAKPPVAAPLPVLWLAPAPQRLCFLTTPFDPPRALPWAVIRVRDEGEQAELGVAASAEVLASAPTCQDTGEKPNATLRRASYQHFGVAPPAWDQPASGADGKRDDKKPER